VRKGRIFLSRAQFFDRMKQIKYILTIIAIFLLTLSSCKDKANESKKKFADSTLSDKSHNPGYNELANPNNEKSFPISDYNTDNKDLKNIIRPSKSVINSTIDTSILFSIWTSDPSGPHADFVFSGKSFFVVDYDGNGDMPYILIDKKLKVFYNDFVQEGEIISVSKDTLKIKWKDYEFINNYVKWKN
jgi:hypothetical protein